MLDILIRNGKVVDGSGNEPFHADVGILDGKIVCIAKQISAEANEIIDATGKYVTPGFIDIHRHADANVLTSDFGRIELSQGLTTIVNGQCGLSITPCPPPHKEKILDFLEPVIGSVDRNLPIEHPEDYFSFLENHPLALNVGMCIGNGTLRMVARGFESGDLTTDQMEKVHKLLREGLEAGALGVTMGIVYAPENCYNFEGFVEALRPMRDYNVPLVAHIRGYGDLLHNSLKEIISIAKAVDVPLHISHMMAVGKQNWGRGLNQALAILDDARQEGL